MKHMRNAVVMLLLAAGAPLQAQRQPPSPEATIVSTFIRANYRTPEQYVLSKFAAHDVVLLGEMHFIKQQLLLVQGLVPLLHERGIHNLATEFARRVDQPLIDSLLLAPEYDERLAREIVFRWWVTWGFEEYLDIFHAAWKVNHARKPGSQMFRILAMNNAPNWHLVPEDPARRTEAFEAVYHGEEEKDWAGPVLHAVRAGGKVLVHTGMHHALTRYRQPIVIDRKLVRYDSSRVGNVLYRELGDRTFFIAQYMPWPDRTGYGRLNTLPAHGAIERALLELPPGMRRAGFDLRGTPVGALADTLAVYSFGYEPFTLEKFADGYVTLAALADFEAVTPVPDWINEGNLERARRDVTVPSMRGYTVEQFQRDANLDVKALIADFFKRHPEFDYRN
ncbi:MAG TPA: hypothetical protein VFO52_06735 [Longimicrobiales bacterium]|nr:hypothetical protein [Longimicrobiales bacterium]